MNELQKKIMRAEEHREHIDFITLVPDGEPTLDIHVGTLLNRAQRFNIKTAVITNASLLWRKDVREDLHQASWISVKIDAVSKKLWKHINRPHKNLELDKVLEGISTFSEEFPGELTTETMLIQNVNDTTEELIKIGDFISQLSPKISYLAIPTRPPAEPWACAASEHTIAAAYHLFTERSINTELLTGYEGDQFAYTGNIEQDVLSITAVHPMKEEGISALLKKAGAEWDSIEKLITDGKLVKVTYEGSNFYTRKL
jgi:wyosine [tRNA(Phe)-imidazoG37] synthetase (radical SAM superfamily)